MEAFLLMTEGWPIQCVYHF